MPILKTSVIVTDKAVNVQIQFERFYSINI